MAIAGCLTLVPGAAFGCGSARDEPPAENQTSGKTSVETSEETSRRTSAENASEAPDGEDGSASTREDESTREDGKTSPEEASRGKGSGDDALVLVDREHELPENYEPEDLVQLQKQGVPTLEDREMRLREEAAGALSELIEDAEATGVELVVGSAYRSHERQVVSYENWTYVFGEEGSGFSAPPGHSEHQLGTAADFTNAAAGYELGQWFGKTAAAKWLRQNAAQYGFIMSYPKDSRGDTGYEWEPWHYRYIGPDNAARYIEGGYASPRQFLLEEGTLPSGAKEPPAQSATQSANSGGEDGPQDETRLQGGG